METFFAKANASIKIHKAASNDIFLQMNTISTERAVLLTSGYYDDIMNRSQFRLMDFTYHGHQAIPNKDIYLYCQNSIPIALQETLAVTALLKCPESDLLRCPETAHLRVSGMCF